MLAEYRGVEVDPDVAFTAGLRHHIGKTALAHSHRGDYEAVMATVYNEGRSITDFENEKFGFSHAKLDDPVARLCALTTVTSLCLSELGLCRSRPIENLDLAAQPAWAFLDLLPTDVDPILEICANRIKESQVLVG